MFKSISDRRILIVSDQSETRDVLKQILQTVDQRSNTQTVDSGVAGYQIDCAINLEDALGTLMLGNADARPYALAFVDLPMPRAWDCGRTVQVLQRINPGLQIAICPGPVENSADQILATAPPPSGVLRLHKPFDPADIRQIAVTLTDKWSAQQERDALSAVLETRTAELQHVALHDALTGLPNRMLFNDRLSATLRRIARNPDHRFAILLVNPDRFKVVNDSLGHGAGDQLLLELARRLQIVVRDTDLVAVAGQNFSLAARLSGDEFAILLDTINTNADAARVAERIVRQMELPYLIDNQEVHSTVSIGITTNSTQYQSAELMLRDADTAMHRAKDAGGSRFVMFDQAMHRSAVERLVLENDLRHAVERGQIELHYQPIVHMRTRALLGFEALARWNHPARGSVSPATFIPVAEETGIILPLGIWILEQACRQLAIWTNQYPQKNDLTMSVNLSRKQLAMPDLLPRISQILQQSAIDPRQLKIEITESAIMDDTDQAVTILKNLQAMNVQVHMDDFGTGYSSLSCLHQFPLDGLKIDRQFVSSITTRRDHAAVIRAIVQLAHSLRIPLVAEGIETLEQIQVLESIGCALKRGVAPCDKERSCKQE